MKDSLKNINVHGRKSGLAAALLASAALACHSFAGTETAPTVTTTSSSNSAQSLFSDWWNGQYATGNWFGLRDTLEDHGLTLGGSWKSYYYGIVSGKEAHGAFDEELKFIGHLDFAKATGLAALDGLTADASVRWRDGSNPNNYVGAMSNFQPSNIQSGRKWRLMPIYMSYTTPELFGVKNFLTVSGGWQNPYDFFVQQPLSKLFVNNAFVSSKGIGGNIQWSSSYAAWGGYMKVKPTSWFYAQAGLYEAIPDSTNTGNQGLDFAGIGPNTTPYPGPNGLEAIGEVGFTPNLGPSELPGKYAFGGYYFGNWNKSYNGVNYPGRYGFYWQADQMLFRAPSPAPATVAAAPDGKEVADAKEAKEVAPTPGKPKLSDKGLYTFSLLTYAPAYDNILPFYFQVGLVYKGLIPTRDNDQFGVAFGYGSYSFDNIQTLQANGTVNQPNYSGVLEFDYRVQVTKFAYFAPFVQYIIKPAGTQAVPNATIVGWAAGVTF